jgi:hypothetical protein
MPGAKHGRAACRRLQETVGRIGEGLRGFKKAGERSTILNRLPCGSLNNACFGGSAHEGPLHLMPNPGSAWLQWLQLPWRKPTGTLVRLDRSMSFFPHWWQ